MDHLQHWRNGSLRSQLLSLPRRPLPNPVITEATTEQSERGKEERTGERGEREREREMLL